MQNERVEFRIDTLNSTFDSKDNFYWAVWQLGWYLPSIGAKCMTVKYLSSVIQGAVFRVKRQDIQIRVSTYKKIPKIQLYEKLIATREVEEWGFDIYHLPDKQFLLDLIFYFRPESDLFSFRPQRSESQATMEFPLHHVNTMVVPQNSIAPLFKKTEEQRERERNNRLQQGLLKKEKRVQLLKSEVEKLIKEAQEIKNSIPQ